MLDFRFTCPAHSSAIWLGWGPFFAGLWFSEWLNWQTVHHRTHCITICSTTWLKQTVHWVQDFLHSLWLSCNSILHGCTTNQVTQAHHNQLNSFMDDLFTRLLPTRTLYYSDHLLFGKYTVQQIKAFWLGCKKPWINTAELVIASYQTRCAQTQWFLSFFQWDPG